MRPVADTVAPRGAEIGAGERPHERVGRARRVERGDTGAEQPGGDQPGGDDRPVTAQLDTEDRGRGERPTEHECAVATEIPERVRDQPAAVPLDPAQHVRARADDEIGARIDDGVRERERVAAVLAEEHLGARCHVLVRDAFGAGVHRHDDDVGLLSSHARRGAWRRRCRSGSAPTGTARSRSRRPGSRAPSGR